VDGGPTRDARRWQRHLAGLAKGGGWGRWAGPARGQGLGRKRAGWAGSREKARTAQRVRVKFWERKGKRKIQFRN
jgi:hypothetical protein